MVRLFRSIPALMVSLMVSLMVLGAVLVASAQKSPGGRAPASPGPQAQPSRPLPNVLIKTTDAKGINLRRFRGKEVILVLFSTECEGCLVTMGYMNKIQQDLGPRGLQVIGVGINENAPYTVAPWAQRYKMTFPVGFLDQESVIKIANMKKDDRAIVPIIMFIDSTSVVRVQYFGDNPLMKDKQQERALRAIADSLLKWQVEHVAAEKAAAAPKPETPPPAKPEP